MLSNEKNELNRLNIRVFSFLFFFALMLSMLICINFVVCVQQQFMVLKQQGKQGQGQIKLVPSGTTVSGQPQIKLTQTISTAQLQKMQPRIISTQKPLTPGELFVFQFLW